MAKKRAATKPAAKRRAKAKPSRRPRRDVTYVREDGERFSFSSTMPLLPLRDVVIFPGMIVPLLVGRPQSVVAVERAVANEAPFCVVAQTDPGESEPLPEDLHDVGTVVRALQVLRVPDGTLKILVEGICRVAVTRFDELPDHLAVKTKLIEPSLKSTSDTKARVRQVVSAFRKYVKLNPRIPDEVLTAIGGIDNPRLLTQMVWFKFKLDLSVR
ncbi:MAG: hypothetical protein HKN12_06005, partial [Gemmatimonadetes bacterium]|nr:hypothetical protein [Gemmatimonadota bacterium]